jgi:hypothetical protein
MEQQVPTSDDQIAERMMALLPKSNQVH